MGGGGEAPPLKGELMDSQSWDNISDTDAAKQAQRSQMYLADFVGSKLIALALCQVADAIRELTVCLIPTVKSDE